MPQSVFSLAPMMHNGKWFSLARPGLLLAMLAVCGLAACTTGGGTAAGRTTGAVAPVVVPPMSIGDSISVVLSDIPGLTAPLTFNDKVAEDGTITLHLGKKCKAEGKTALQLQQEIYKLYVPDIYRKLTVSVATGDQFYTVTGYVKNASIFRYIGPTTVTKAIATAGYLMDFGSKKIILIRANGQRLKVNYDRIIAHPEEDPPVYPGDTVQVNRRGLFG